MKHIVLPLTLDEHQYLKKQAASTPLRKWLRKNIGLPTTREERLAFIHEHCRKK